MGVCDTPQSSSKYKKIAEKKIVFRERFGFISRFHTRRRTSRLDEQIVSVGQIV